MNSRILLVLGVFLVILVSGCTDQSIPSPAPGFVQIGLQYYGASSPTAINGKLAYVASSKDNPIKSFIVYDGKEIGKEYDSVGAPYEVNGKLAYVATKRGRHDTYFMVYDGHQIGREYVYISNDPPAGVNGTIAFLAGDIGKAFIVFDGQEIGKQYLDVSSTASVNGQLAYVATDKLSGRSFVVYNGTEYGTEYDSTESPKEVNGKLAYLASKSFNYPWFIVYDGKEIGKVYDKVLCFSDVNGQIAYTAERNGTLFFVYDGNESKLRYEICSPIKVGNKMAYSAYDELEGGKGFKTFIIYGNQEIGKEYKNAREPADINGKLAYMAETNSGKDFIVMEE